MPIGAEIPAKRNARATIGDVVAPTGQTRWYAVYTRANVEKRVALQFVGRGVEHFLPQYESVRRWKDRRVRLQLPLFPGYLFVHLAAQERFRVLQVRGVVRLVGFNGSPTPIPEEDVEKIREFLGKGWRAEPHPFITVGHHVEIKRGPLAGMKGVLVRKKGRPRVVLSVDGIKRSIAVEVASEDLF
jgi:transcription antitermination factor NusG